MNTYCLRIERTAWHPLYTGASTVVTALCADVAVVCG